jgi:2-dehydropantoate 2-reductase
VAHPQAHHLDELPSLGKADVVFVAMKSYDTSWIAKLATEHMHDRTVVLSSQNGMNDKTIADIVGPGHVLGCVVEMGVELFTPAQVRRTSGAEWGTLVVGDLGLGDAGRIDEIAELLSPMDGVSTAGDLWPYRWSKLTLNVMSNALGGLTGLSTNGLWSDEAVVDVLIALGHEVALTARANGISMAPVLHGITHEQWLAATAVGNPGWLAIREIMYGIAGTRTGDKENLPSLLQDIRKSRRTEVDYLNGWIARGGAAVGVATPANAAIVDALRPVELGRRPAARDNVLPLTKLVHAQYAG